jgi:hypothetical protein
MTYRLSARLALIEARVRKPEPYRVLMSIDESDEVVAARMREFLLLHGLTSDASVILIRLRFEDAPQPPRTFPPYAC